MSEDSLAFIQEMKEQMIENLSKDPMIYEFYLSYNSRYIKHSVLQMNHNDTQANKLIQTIALMALKQMTKSMIFKYDW